MIHFDELRKELVAPTVWGQESPVRSEADCIERHGGRIIPAVEASLEDLSHLKKISRALSLQAETLIGFEEFDSPIPNPSKLARITFDLVQGCWTLPISPSAERRRDTYGRMVIPGIVNPSSLAHRTMYKVFFGLDSLPLGRADHLDHLCETKPCCNPRHLEKVSHTENNRRGRVIKHGTEPLF